MRIFVIAVVSLLAIACTREVIIHEQPQPTAADASVPDAATAASSAPAGPQTPPDNRPRYKSGDYAQYLPEGSLVLPQPDGGVLRVHDGNEHPCVLGCVAIYTSALQSVTQREQGPIVDGDDVQRKVAACIAEAKRTGCDKMEWPKGDGR
jgi:hypothetical protein